MGDEMTVMADNAKAPKLLDATDACAHCGWDVKFDAEIESYYDGRNWAAGEEPFACPVNGDFGHDVDGC